MFKVRYCGDNRIYNSKGLTIGRVYEVKAIAYSDPNMLLIHNDNDEETYYNKAIFDESVQDFEDSPYQYLTEDTINTLKKEDAEFSEFIYKLSEAIQTITAYGKNAELSKSLYKILDGFNKNPMVTIDLLNGYLGTIPLSYKYYPVYITKRKQLKALDGYLYKATADDPTTRIIHESDCFLLMSHILVIVPSNEDNLETI